MKNKIILLLLVCVSIHAAAGENKRMLFLPENQGDYRQVILSRCFIPDKKIQPESPLHAVKKLYGNMTSVCVNNKVKVFLKVNGTISKLRAKQGNYAECYPAPVFIKIQYSF